MSNKIPVHACVVIIGGGIIGCNIGQPTGFAQNGSVSVANNAERFEELKRGASTVKVFGLEVEVVTPKEAADKWPLMNASDLVGAVWLPGDGRINLADTTQAFAKGARQKDAVIVEGIRAQGRLIHAANASE